VNIDSISAGIVLDELNKSIEDSTTNIKALKKEIKELRATTESEDFKFMDKEIPSG
jgi:peptidoglycan hydrolase CwlO-like protein